MESASALCSRLPWCVWYELPNLGIRMRGVGLEVTLFRFWAINVIAKKKKRAALAKRLLGNVGGPHP